MSKLAIITLKTRQELIGEDQRFKIKTDNFEGSYTNTLALGIGSALLVQQDEVTGHFELPPLDDNVTAIRIHKSWAATVDYPVQTADELADRNDDPRKADAL